METKAIANLILECILKQKESIAKQYDASKNNIGYFFIDDVLPEDIAMQCFTVFPKPDEMKVLKSLREYKHVSAQMNAHNKLLESVIYAFQDYRIVKSISKICKIDPLYPDDSLYAGGLSLMKKDNFLNPHLDNSHDANRDRWRVLNLLYYVTPNWKKESGGHLELWPNGPKNEPFLIESKFNRLVVMATHQTSWHSVNKVTIDASRCCISNYYFSDNALKEKDKFHVTKFRGRPNQTIINIILDADAKLRMLLRSIFKKGVRKNPHIYKKGKN